MVCWQEDLEFVRFGVEGVDAMVIAGGGGFDVGVWSLK